MKKLERARWRCRRGLLELDIVLQRFMDEYYAKLNEAELRQFETLLDLPDNDLWDMIALKRSRKRRFASSIASTANNIAGSKRLLKLENENSGEQYETHT